MARSGILRWALIAAVALLGVTLAVACSSPTARPEGDAAPAPAGDFSGPPGPIGVPDAGQDEGYPGSSVESIPTERNPYPGPDEADAGDEGDEGSAAEGEEETSDEAEPTEEAPAEATPES